MSSGRNIFTVRIRGIYSTALAKIFLDEGFVFGDLSTKLMNRLGIGKEDLAAYTDLTVKNDDEYKDVIVFMGFPEAVDKATEIFRKYFTSSIIEEPKPLYAVYKGVVEKKISQDECLVSTPLGIPGVLRDMICSPGQELILTIVGYRNDLETPILRRGISVVGKYMILDDTGRVQFSEHIRDSDVIEELRGFTEIITRERFGVKWRSSAKNATTINILEEYTSLKELYRKVLDQVANADNNRFLYVGEKIGFMQLSTKDLIKLDEIRSYVYPTAPFH
ncbi:MAG: ribonuclease E/G, partial [Sulfolobales archaeon]